MRAVGRHVRSHDVGVCCGHGTSLLELALRDWSGWSEWESVTFGIMIVDIFRVVKCLAEFEKSVCFIGCLYGCRAVDMITGGEGGGEEGA